jgi:hypothetical protein
MAISGAHRTPLSRTGTGPRTPKTLTASTSLYGVATQIAKRLLGPAERAFGVYHPVATEQSPQQGCESGRCDEVAPSVDVRAIFWTAPTSNELEAENVEED